MKQSFIRKIALLMCAVMLFSALPFGVSAQAATANTTSSSAGVNNTADGSTAEETSPAVEVMKTLLTALKKVVVAISDYLAEQEKQEQQKPEKDLSETGIAGYLYDSGEKCFYTASDPWQRTVGYNELFDVFSEVALIDFDTMRVKFDYKNKNWLIQIWKGQYGLLFYGAEIGVYNKPSDRKLAHYDAVKDNERLKMSMDFYEYKKELFSNKVEWKKQFSRPYGYYWWCTGFIPGNRNDEFEKLRVDARITAMDYDMLAGITASVKRQGIKYQVNGLDIRFTYQ